MTTEQVEKKIREMLHAAVLDEVRAPGILVETVVRRRNRRRFSQIVGATVAVAAITVGAVVGFGSGDPAERGRPARPAASPTAPSPAVPPAGWKPWRIGVQGAGERGCLVDGSALYCSGSRYDAAKFDADTGKRLWTVEVNREGDGIDHPFAVRDKVVFAYRNHTSQNQPNGDYAGGTDLMAVNADTGELLWTVEMPQDDRTEQAAMLIDGAVLANTPTVRTMTALDPLTGKEKWHYTWEKGTVCQRAVLSGVPYLLCTQDTERPDGTDVFRLDPATGSVKEVRTLPGAQGLIGTSRDRMVLIGAGDAADADRRVTMVSGSGRLTSHTLHLEGEWATSQIVDDRLVAVSWQGQASAYSLTSGKTLWTAPVGIEVPGENTIPGIATPVGAKGQGVVYFVNPAGDLSGLDLRTGKQVWRDHVDSGKRGPGPGSSPQLMLYGGVLVARNGSEMISLLPQIGD
ncbi:PQQ-binding-like beta-propeller repeat protein [Streptomyces sp. NPDC001500]